MVDINENTVRAYFAARDLARLYLAYQAESRAQIAAAQQLQRHIERGGIRRPGEEAVVKAKLNRTEAFLRELDATYDARRKQVEGRLLELMNIPRLP